MEDLEQTQEKDESYPQTISLLAGLVRDDRGWLLTKYLSLVIVPIFLRIFDIHSLTILIIAFLLQQVIELHFLFELGKRSIKKCANQLTKLSDLEPNFIKNFYLIGFALSAIVKLPQVLMQTTLKDNLVVALTVISIFGIFVNFRFIAYSSSFFLQLASKPSKLKTLNFAALYTNKNRFLAIKLLLGPFIIHYLLDSAISVLDPVGKSIYVILIKDLSSGCYYFLSSLMIVAYSIIARPNNSGLDYSELSTYKIRDLQKSGKKNIQNKFLRKNIFKYALILTLLNFANTVRVMTQKPHFEINLKQIEVHKNDLILSLELKDPVYNLRGLQYLLFRVASEKKFNLSAWPRIKVENEQVGSKNVKLIFATERKAEHLKTLKDIYLYYGDNQIIKLPMETALDLPK